MSSLSASGVACQPQVGSPHPEQHRCPRGSENLTPFPFYVLLYCFDYGKISSAIRWTRKFEKHSGPSQ